MIQAVKGICPDILISKGREEHLKLLEQYKAGIVRYSFNKAIYAHESVKEALIRDNGEKCCFCESSSPRDFHAVEHYRPKTAYRDGIDTERKYPGYFWLAYEWHNLFIICNACNTVFKNDIFPLEAGSTRAHHNNLKTEGEIPSIINPLDDPSQHLRYRAYKLFPTSDVGRNTIELLGLNHPLQTDNLRQNYWAQKLQKDREEYYNLMKFIYLNGGAEVVSAYSNRLMRWSYMIKCGLEDKFKY
ncbi:hypothetical protein GC194_05170 [bacterium]|nr:hypothetical protein [bacterium]